MKYRVRETFPSYLVLLQMVGLAIPLFWNLNLSMSCILFLCAISGGGSTDVPILQASELTLASV